MAAIKQAADPHYGAMIFNLVPGGAPDNAGCLTGLDEAFQAEGGLDHLLG